MFLFFVNFQDFKSAKRKLYEKSIYPRCILLKNGVGKEVNTK